LQTGTPITSSHLSESEDVPNGFVFEVANERRGLHAQTLAYMLHGPPLESKRSPQAGRQESADRDTLPEVVEIPEGSVTLVPRRGDRFGWYMELREGRNHGTAFSIAPYAHFSFRLVEA